MAKLKQKVYIARCKQVRANRSETKKNDAIFIIVFITTVASNFNELLNNKGRKGRVGMRLIRSEKAAFYVNRNKNG